MAQSMIKRVCRRAGRAALVMSVVLAPAAPAAAQYAPPPLQAERPEDALARNLRLIAQNPRNFLALVAAGRAALATGDTQAAVGFFGRAEEVSPQSWQPQAGMAAAMVAMGDPRGAFNYFARAQQFGAAHILIAADRGLAFDLIGDQPRAQSDYRAALVGADADEARRRLALSLAISRDMKGAAATIEPLLRRRDPEAIRINAFVLALAGDRDGARRSIDSVMPGAGARFDPFFKILPVLRPDEKAAAVHLGEFPKDAAQRYAYAQPIPTSPVVTVGGSRQTIVSTAQPRRQATPARQQQEPSVDKPRAKSAAKAAKSRPIREPFFASNDPSRLRSTFTSQAPSKPKPKATQSEPVQSPPASEPQPRQAGRLDDIAALLTQPSPTPESVTTKSEPVAPPPEPLVRVAEAQVPEPGFDLATQLVSVPKVERSPLEPPISQPKVERTAPKSDAKAAADKKKADKLAAEKKAKAEAEKKAKAEAARLGVAGTNWVQIAGGSNQDRMASEYKKLVAKAGSLLKARSGYVTQGKDYFRLLVGPFATTEEAQEFVSKLDKAGVDSFRWTRNPAQIRIEKLKS
jgi:Flp pilus assembly protein TadD